MIGILAPGQSGKTGVIIKQSKQGEGRRGLRHDSAACHTTATTATTTAAAAASASSSPSAAAAATGASAGVCNDIKPIPDSNCIVCHGGPNPAAGRNYTTCTGVMAVVTRFSANSPLVRETQPGGIMASHLTAAQAELTRLWVVVYGAPQQ